MNCERKEGKREANDDPSAASTARATEVSRTVQDSAVDVCCVDFKTIGESFQSFDKLEDQPKKRKSALFCL